jgi:hypothetical protein
MSTRRHKHTSDETLAFGFGFLSLINLIMFLDTHNNVFYGEICHFAIKNQSQATLSRELFLKNSKKSPHFEEENYEIAKIFQGFGQFF